MDIKMNIKRSEKICKMIFELFRYIDSIDDEIEKKASMDAAIMTMIDISASSNNVNSITMAKHILKDFEIRGI